MGWYDNDQMAVQADPATRARSVGEPLPLENGDRLTRGEFERRYASRPDLKKAELIEGVVYLPSPVRSASHAEPHAAILGWLVTYWRVIEHQIDWFVLSDGEYRPMTKNPAGTLESSVFPGLRSGPDQRVESIFLTSASPSAGTRTPGGSTHHTPDTATGLVLESGCSYTSPESKP